VDGSIASSLGKITAANPSNILEFIGYMEKFPSEMAADFRQFYGVSVWDIPTKITWAEALLLFRQLMNTTESRTLAAMNQWERPFTFGDVIAMEHWDLTYAANSEKKERFKRPWEVAKKLTKGTMPLDKAVQFFSRLGHK
jgi:hypothetical protein